MKKILALLIVTCLCISLSGCMLSGLGSLASHSLNAKKAEIAEKESEIPRIGFAKAGDEDYTDTLFIDTSVLNSYVSDLSRYRWCTSVT